MILSSAAAQRLLALWLRLGGAVCASSLIAVVMPQAWHEAIHAALGLGDFPKEPIAEYLARGMSGMCGFYGLLLILLAGDVRHNLSLIVRQSCLLPAISLFATLSLTNSGMPLWWIYGDFLSVCGFSSVVLLLARRCR